MKIDGRSVPTCRSAAVWGCGGTSRRKANDRDGQSYSKAKPTPTADGLTLVEVLIVIAVIVVLAMMMVPATTTNRARALRLRCINNLKESGFAFRIWGDDRGRDGTYPIQLSETNGGMMELMHGLNAFRAFQIMSNQLVTPEVLFCPADGGRIQATTFNLKPLAGQIPFASNSNLSYFVGLDSTEIDPNRILSGDRNITNGTPLKNGILELTTNKPAGWTAEMHNKVGNILLADGSAQQMSTMGLQAMTNATSFTNRLLMPLLTQ